MAIVRWDPFDAFLGAQEDLNRMFRRSLLRVTVPKTERKKTKSVPVTIEAEKEKK